MDNIVSNYVNSIQIPKSWSSLENFISWFIESKFPLLVPLDAPVFITDDATAISIFRKPPYQVEWYLIHPNMAIPYHGHPGLEVITLPLGGGNVMGPDSIYYRTLSKKLENGEFHGGKDSTHSQGFVLLSFERWPQDIPITSASVCWKGDTAGPIHDKLIESYYPGAVKRLGYADVTDVL
jgi:hypothetical protein